MDILRMLKCCHRHRNRRNPQELQGDPADTPEKLTLAEKQQHQHQHQQQQEQQQQEHLHLSGFSLASSTAEEIAASAAAAATTTATAPTEAPAPAAAAAAKKVAAAAAAIAATETAAAAAAAARKAAAAATTEAAENVAAAAAAEETAITAAVAAAVAAAAAEAAAHAVATELETESVAENVSGLGGAAAAEGSAAAEADTAKSTETRVTAETDTAAAAEAAAEGADNATIKSITAAGAVAEPTVEAEAAAAAGEEAVETAATATTAAPTAATRRAGAPSAGATDRAAAVAPETAASAAAERVAAAATAAEAKRMAPLHPSPYADPAAAAAELPNGTLAAVAAGLPNGTSGTAAAAAAVLPNGTSGVAEAVKAAASALAVVPSSEDKSQGSLGSTLFDKKRGICSFRFWGPHVSMAWVEVAGERFPMVQEGGDHWSVCLSGVHEGLRYHFVLQSSCNHCYHTEGELLHRRDPYARFCEFSNNDCFVVAPAAAASGDTPQVQPWTKWIIYELHPGTFVSPAEKQTVFEAIAEKLDHIVSLGFTAVELMPVQEFGGLWGYNPRLLLALHSPYGEPQTLKALVDACHRKGLAVIIDIVLNHGSSKLNSLWNWDGYGPNNNGGIYFEGGGESGWGRKFAFYKKEIRKMIKAAAACFIQEYHADGLRLDSVHNMTWDLLKELTADLKKHFPGKMLIAELTPENPKICWDAGFDACWIHSAYYDAMKIMRNEETPHHIPMLKNIVNIHHGFSKSSQCINSILGSHDQAGNRKGGQTDGKHGKYFVSLLGGRSNWHSRAQCRMWYSLQAVSRGIPMLFMGAETLQDGYWNVERNCEFKWNILDDPHAKQMQALVRAANLLRVAHSDLTDETQQVIFTHEDPHNRVLGFRRGSLLIVLNCGEGQWEGTSCRYSLQTSLQRGASLRQIFNSQAEEFGGWRDSAGEETLHVEADGWLALVLPKWAVVVYQGQ